MLHSSYKSQVIELFKSIKVDDEFEVMFNNYKSSNMLSLVNFINIMKNEGYIEDIEPQPQILSVYSNDHLLTIKGARKILYYCNNNNFKYDEKSICWFNHSRLSKHIINTLFDSNLIFLSIKKTKIDTDKTPVINWDNMRKYFKLDKYITYTDTKTNIKST